MSKKKIKESSMDDEMLTAVFNYWYSDHGRVRSPFPEYIRAPLRVKTLDVFWGCINSLSEKTRKEINDTVLVEMSEEILFEMALGLVLTDDERITIRYPMMMRLGDRVEQKDISEEQATSKVIDRWLIKREGGNFMKVKLQNIKSGKNWETEFELPE